jgi:signal transduction histidine kinase
VSQNDFLSALAYIYLGLMAAFTVCQLLLLRRDNRVQISLWLMSNGFNAVSIVGSPHLLTAVTNRDFAGWAATASLMGALFRYAALGYRTKSFVQDRLGAALVILTIVGVALAFVPALLDVRLLITSISAVAISIACLLVAKKNRYWTNHNEFGLSLVLIGMGLSAIALTLRLVTAYPFGEDKFFLGTSQTQVLGMQALVAMSLFLQIGFTGMLVARQDKRSKFLDRRNLRAWQRNVLAAQRTRNIRKAGDDRLDFMALLTHEVRQPINNAQASLQSITPELEQLSTGSKRAAHALDRAKSSLDDITLALSNAIVAGTLSTDDTRWSRQTVEAPEILEMALLDCSASSRKHIIITPPDGPIFIDGVPILLRVALHNLFQYALGLAENGGDIIVSVAVDDVKFGVTFVITSKVGKGKFISTTSGPDLKINDKDPTQMKNLAFFVAGMVAQYHLGECKINEDDSGNFYIKFFILQI